MVDEVVLPLASALTQACPDVTFKLPEYGELKEVPDVPLLEVPDVPAAPDCPEDPDVPVDPELPEVPVDPDVPVSPDVPDVPFPDVPEVPDCPDVPANPEVPDEPLSATKPHLTGSSGGALPELPSPIFMYEPPVYETTSWPPT